MKRFNLSQHIFYLFKPDNNFGTEQKSREDVFVPKLFVNLYNLANRQKKINMKAYNNNQTKFFLLNSNSYFSNLQMAKMKTFDINKNYVANNIFGNNKRYNSNRKKFMSQFPRLQKNNNGVKFQKINRNILNKQNSNQKQKKKLTLTNTRIKVKNLEYPKEIENNFEDKSKNLIDLSVEYKIEELTN